MYIPGLDKGAVMAGYNNNFAWGTLDITGDMLNLFDGDGVAGRALYVGEILGAVHSSPTITNIHGAPNLNIYYDPSLPGNAYLGGLTYDLTGGGQLAPVPVPSTLLLLGSGLLGVVGIMRKRFKRN